MMLVDVWKTVVLQRFMKFDGRAGRPEFWWFALSNFVVVVVLVILAQASVLFSVLYVIYGLGVLLPEIGVAIRRLQDTDKSGWFILLAFVPIVGGIILIVLFCLEGTPGPNRYGEAPEPVPAA